MAKIRLTIEYDLDVEEGTVVTQDMLQAEALAWIQEAVSLRDVLAVEGPQAFTLTLA